MSQRALVTGATGLLGREVVKAFDRAGWEVVGAGFSRASPPKVIKLDIQDEREVQRVLDEVKQQPLTFFANNRPNVVVHCAANRSPDSCTSDPDAARRVNVTSTKHLAKCTSSRSILLIYISTDYVFPGIRGQAPYKWADCPQPPNVYGQTKLDGEEALLNYTKGTGLGVVLRVPVLYGHVEPEGNNKESAVNVIMDALWKSQDKLDAPNAEKVKMDDWAQRYPTNTEDVGRVCVEISKHYLGVLATGDVQAKMDLPSILQFSSEDKMTKYEICQVFAEIMGLSMDGVVPEKDGGGGASGTVRPYDCHLDTSRLKELGIDISTANFVMWWRREVRAFRH